MSASNSALRKHFDTKITKICRGWEADLVGTLQNCITGSQVQGCVISGIGYVAIGGAWTWYSKLCELLMRWEFEPSVTRHLGQYDEFDILQTIKTETLKLRVSKSPLRSDRIMPARLIDKKSYMVPSITLGSFSTIIVLPLRNITRKLGSDHEPICPKPFALPTVTAPIGLGLGL
jgi:hypothetical protein